MAEPRRCVTFEKLDPEFCRRVEVLLGRMRARGFDPLVFETWRSRRRQEWLYGVGRKHHRYRRPVTWSRSSRHEEGLAVDIISASHQWDDVDFFDALCIEAISMGFRTLPHDRCHVELR